MNKELQKNSVVTRSLAGKTQGQDGAVGTSCLVSYLSTFSETCSGINLPGVRIVRAQEKPKRLCLPFPLRRKYGLLIPILRLWGSLNSKVDRSRVYLDEWCGLRKTNFIQINNTLKYCLTMLDELLRYT